MPIVPLDRRFDAIETPGVEEAVLLAGSADARAASGRG
jgi:hypothetical protein